MPIAGLFQKLRHRRDERAEKLRRRRVARLVEKASELGRRLRPRKEADEAREKATAYRCALDENVKKWEAWRHLLELHRLCDQQARDFTETQILLSKATEVGLKPDEETTLFGLFGSSSKDAEDTILAGRVSWQAARAAVEEKIPNIFLISAFLRLAEVSRVEVAALFSGGLVLSGMVYSQAFYYGAIGSHVLRYVTVEDFLDEGVRGLGLGAFFLIVAEGSFYLFRRQLLRSSRNSHKWGYRPHLLVVKRPARVAVGTFLLVLAGVALIGGVRGGWERRTFLFTEAEDLESATVMVEPPSKTST